MFLRVCLSAFWPKYSGLLSGYKMCCSIYLSYLLVSSTLTKIKSSLNCMSWSNWISLTPAFQSSLWKWGYVYSTMHHVSTWRTPVLWCLRGNSLPKCWWSLSESSRLVSYLSWLTFLTALPDFCFPSASLLPQPPHLPHACCFQSLWQFFSSPHNCWYTLVSSLILSFPVAFQVNPASFCVLLISKSLCSLLTYLLKPQRWRNTVFPNFSSLFSVNQLILISYLMVSISLAVYIGPESLFLPSWSLHAHVQPLHTPPWASGRWGTFQDRFCTAARIIFLFVIITQL